MAQRSRANDDRLVCKDGSNYLVIEVSEEEAYPILISESYDGNNTQSSSSFSIPTASWFRFPPLPTGPKDTTLSLTRLILRDNLYYDS